MKIQEKSDFNKKSITSIPFAGPILLRVSEIVFKCTTSSMNHWGGLSMPDPDTRSISSDSQNISPDIQNISPDTQI